jgi:hypothetical protein
VKENFTKESSEVAGILLLIDLIIFEIFDQILFTTGH